MARPSIKKEIEEKVTAYIESVNIAGAGSVSLATSAVALAIGHDRRVLKKYGQDVRLADAAKQLNKRKKSGINEKHLVLEQRIASLSLELSRLGMQVNALLAQAALIEGNAKRLGINPDDLYRPLVPPDRSVSKIYGVKSGKSRNNR